MTRFPIEGSRVAVLGAGRSGCAAALLARREGAHVSVIDSGKPDKLRAAKPVRKLKGTGIETFFGTRALKVETFYDLAVLSPGIALDAPLPQLLAERQVPIVGELEFAYRHCPWPVVGITGTNGKTTTTELTAALLNGAGKQTVAAGNIGRAFSEVVLEAEDLEVVTLEISSFQLETIERFRPAVAVWLNFAPDHLDRYTDVGEYREAKLRLFDNQKSVDRAVVNAADSPGDLCAETLTFTAYGKVDADFELRDDAIHFCGEPVLRLDETRLRGRHNAENLMAAMAAAYHLGISFQGMAESIAEYTPPPHRCELIATIDGVEFINDSKATNLHALECSLLSQSRPVILIAGGKEKGLPFETLAPLIKERASRVILIGESAQRLSDGWNDAAPCELAPDLEGAVAAGCEAAREGDAILFAPGTSSFDMFTSYEERGDRFREIVNRIREEKP